MNSAKKITHRHVSVFPGQLHVLQYSNNFFKVTKEFKQSSVVLGSSPFVIAKELVHGAPRRMQVRLHTSKS